jgi:hypothetical protein
MDPRDKATFAADNADALADVFVISAFIRVLEPSLAADVVDQDCVETGRPGFHI